MKPAAALRDRLSDALVQALALFTLLNLALQIIDPRLDANNIWIGWRALRELPGVFLTASFAISALFFEALGSAGRRSARVLALGFSLACLSDALTVLGLFRQAAPSSSLPLPLSLFFALLLGIWSLRQDPPETIRRPALRRFLRGALVLPAAVLLLLLHVVVFGRSDYRRPADAIVVFGAGVRPNGSPSLALADRVRTACELYRAGLAPIILMSGGHGHMRPVSEATAMIRLARSLGVPAKALLADERGLSTKWTLHNAQVLARQRAWRRVLLVSHDYHLARIALLAQRQGLRGYTVPARETRPLARGTYYHLRELAAWLYHFAGPLLPWERLKEPSSHRSG